MTETYHTTILTVLGYMRAISNGKAIIRLDWDQTAPIGTDRPDSVSRETIRQLEAYLHGRLKKFKLPLSADGKTATSHEWLQTMFQIPYGQVVTYAEFANMAGKPKAARAAGTACSSNPIPIIYPCHRVIRADSSLGNYGGGSDLHPTHAENLDRKRFLIELEAQNL